MMIIFTIIAIIIVFFLWFNTSIYDYKYEEYHWGIDYSSERRLPFTIWKILGLSLLLIPYFNIVIFIIYLIWYAKRACEPEDSYACIIYDINIKKYSPFLYKIVCFIKNLLDKRIV